MPHALNGFGTMFYGEDDLRPDGSFVTTEWITAAGIPLLPLRSFRLAPISGQNVNVVIFSSETYAVLEKLPVVWPQARRIYAFVLFTGAWWVFIGWLFFDKLRVFDGPSVWVPVMSFVFIMATPFVVVWWARRRAYRARQNASLQPPPA